MKYYIGNWSSTMKILAISIVEMNGHDLILDLQLAKKNKEKQEPSILLAFYKTS